MNWAISASSSSRSRLDVSFSESNHHVTGRWDSLVRHLSPLGVTVRSFWGDLVNVWNFQIIGFLKLGKMKLSVKASNVNLVLRSCLTVLDVSALRNADDGDKDGEDKDERQSGGHHFRNERRSSSSEKTISVKLWKM